MPEGEEGNEQQQQGNEIDLSDPKIKAAIDQAVSTQVAGLKANKDEILEEKRKLKEQYDALQAKWGDLDPEKVQGLIQQFEQSEEAKLIAEGKIEDVLNKRTEAMRQDADTRVQAALGKVTDLEDTIKAKDAKIAELVIDSKVRDAAGALKCEPRAIKDIVLNARMVFGLDENHEPVARTPDGTLRMGKNGKDPLTPAEWLEGERENSPHWWGSNSGGGASGGTKLPDGGKLTEEQLNNMSPKQKMVYAMTHGGKA